MFNLKIPQSIFAHADGFLKTVSILHTDPPNPLCLTAIVVNSAFASELYLKCLLHIETGKLFKGQHDLGKLFAKLSAATQAEIEGPFDEQLSRGPKYDFSGASKEAQEAAVRQPKNLRDALRAGREAFVEWRYLYEIDDLTQANFFSLFPLPDILRVVILRKRPEWGRFRITMTKIADALPTSPVQKTPTQFGIASHFPDGDSR